MNEIERIHKMVEAGTITDVEAERLLSVLREIDQADGELAASGAAMEAEARRADAGPDQALTGNPAATARAVAGEPRAPQADATANAATPNATTPNAATANATTANATTGHAAPGHVGAGAGATEPGATEPDPTEPDPAGAKAKGARAAGAPQGTRWVHVALLAGDVSLRADPDVREVVVRGDTESVQVEPSDDGFTVSQVKGDGQDSWVDRFLSRIRSSHVELRVPAGYGVDLAMTAGDVEIHDVPYLRGRLTSGDLDARGLRGIDFTTAAGDLDLEMTLTEGRHSLRATAGDVNIRLGAGSDVVVEGSVSIGSASVRAPGFDLDRRGVGQRFRGRVGEGTAQLDVHVTTGDVDVAVSDER